MRAMRPAAPPPRPPRRSRLAATILDAANGPDQGESGSRRRTKMQLDELAD